MDHLPTLHDKYLPDFDFSEHHCIGIKQRPDKIFHFVDELDLSQSWLINLLLSLRGLGIGSGAGKGSLKHYFIELECVQNEEIILGLVGQFWTPGGNLRQLRPGEFTGFQQEGFLKATWNFRLVTSTSLVSKLHTETRIKCFGQRAYRRFRIYWFFVKPFSGLIRREILRLIKNKAERR